MGIEQIFRCQEKGIVKVSSVIKRQGVKETHNHHRERKGRERGGRGAEIAVELVELVVEKSKGAA
jgi:hypothetical protein